MKQRLENLENADFKPRFWKKFEQLEPEVQEETADAIQELVKENPGAPWRHPRVKFLEGRRTEGAWRLKIGSRGEKVDHRALFEITDDGNLTFYTIGHRDYIYQE